MAVASILAVTLLSVQRGKIRVSDLVNLSDIVLWFTGALLVLAFAALYLVLDLEKCLRRLSALNEEEAISGNPPVRERVETDLASELMLEETDGLRGCLETALHDLDDQKTNLVEDSDDLLATPETLSKRRWSDADLLPEMLGETTRVDESTEPGDFSGVEGRLLKHTLGSEDSGLDEEFLGGDPESGAESALQLPEGLSADSGDLLNIDRP